MSRITHYMAHDPIANVEGVVTEYDPDLLQQAADGGVIFVAVKDDGSPSIVPAGEVRQPRSIDQEYCFVQPAYVDERAKATLACLEAIAEMREAVSAKARTAAEPNQKFSDALGKLRELVNQGESER